jgi:hypothetical protein
LNGHSSSIFTKINFSSFLHYFFITLFFCKHILFVFLNYYLKKPE